MRLLGRVYKYLRDFIWSCGLSTRKSQLEYLRLRFKDIFIEKNEG